MTHDEKKFGRGTVVASAALTVAVGITVASLAGYLRPTAAEQPKTVLVPVAREPAIAPAQPQPEPMFASYATGRHEREHEREHEHEHD